MKSSVCALYAAGSGLFHNSRRTFVRVRGRYKYQRFWPTQCQLTDWNTDRAMGRVIFYEDRNFTGRSYECSSDCADVSPYLSRCHSCRVESGCWMVYDQPNYMGNQYFIRRGEYPDYMSMWGWGNNCIRSCRQIPMYRGAYRMRIYERENFMGQMMEVTDDCDSVTDRYRWSGGCHSCHVMDGHWLMYEHPHYRGRMWYFRPGEYRSFRDYGGVRFQSMRRIVDSWY